MSTNLIATLRMSKLKLHNDMYAEVFAGDMYVQIPAAYFKMHQKN